MPFLWPMVALAFAADPEPSTTMGFDRLHVDPEMLHVEPTEPDLPVRRATLIVHNGHTARATVHIGDQSVGELLPQATATLEDVTAGAYTVRFEVSGAVRTQRIRTLADDDH